MEFDDISRLIKERRSIRKWQKKEVPDDLLLKALELATWAPNGGNQQNWRFYIIKNEDVITDIADTVCESGNKISSWPEAKEFSNIDANLGKRSSFFREAPVLVGVAMAKYQSHIDKILAAREETDPDAQNMRKWRNIAKTGIQSVASAVAYLLLILHQMGLGAVWMVGPIQAKEKIEKVLKIPSQLDLVALIPVGYPAETPEIKTRKPVQEISEIIR
ncbi:nitroreductase family protein [Chloroflexota bacterium]